MHRIPRRRDIIDRRDLAGQLHEVAGWSGYSQATRGAVVQIFKAVLYKGVGEIRHRFEEEANQGAEVVAANAYLVDQLVRGIHDFACRYVYPDAAPAEDGAMSVTATGGYGRAELAPFSDIDLMFLLPANSSPEAEQIIEFVLYMLWDLGLKVGHASRTVDECVRLARQDLTIRTSLLETRWLWGGRDLFRQFRERFAKDVVAATGAAYVEAKLAERDARHERMGDTRYVLEPHVKEGKGGLRDLQTLFWIAKYLYQVDTMGDLVAREVFTPADVRRFSKAQNFLWTVRCHLHYVTGRPEERLTFNVQENIGRRMGYTDRTSSRGVERFMKHYFLTAKDVGDLTRILCAVLEENNKKRKPLFRLPSFSLRKKTVEGFKVDGGRITVESDDDFANSPAKLIRLFREAQIHGLDIHPHALRLVTQNLNLINAELRADPEANRLFLDMLTDPDDPETTLRRLNEAGVLGRFMPDFGRVVAQMQYDMYHVYTVDEHTVRAIGVLSRIERGLLKDEMPGASEVVSEIQSRRVLYLSVLLHDIAKGRSGDHSEIGAKIAIKMGERFGLSDWETETVSWLVLHHLAMSRTAFKRDIDDPKTVADFVALVQSPERLRLLLVLTSADIRAVGPNIWNAWKSGLLRELFYRAQEEMEMTGGMPARRRAARVERAKAALVARLTDWEPEETERHLARGYSDYWLAFDTDTHVHHAHLIREAEKAEVPLHIETRVIAERAATEITIYAPDHPGLFARIAGAMALSGASIVDAKILTLANGMALDTFWIQDASGNAFEEKERLAKLWPRIEDALTGRMHTARELETVRTRALPSRTGVFKVPPRVIIDNKASNTHTVIEVNGRDRPGFLHDVTAACTELGLQIVSAHVTTYGERAVDVFYVKDVFGLKVEHRAKLRMIERRVLAAIEPQDDSAAEAAAE